MQRKQDRFRRRIGVPKGMLWHLALKILKKQPMSGSEIMDWIQEYADWRPSPGSIYPLLAHLHEDGLIKPHSIEDIGLKRFELTQKGTRVVEQHNRHDDQISKRHRTIHKMYWILHREMPEEMYESFSSLLKTIENNYQKIIDDQESSKRFKDILDLASKELAKIGA
jgi:DNA-binding PadR family transcriptional regulator